MLPVKKSNLQLINKDECRYLIPYEDELVNKEVARSQFERLKNAFGSKIPTGFFLELNTAIKEEKFTNKQLTDAVTKVIKNKIFPSIAEIMDSAHKIRLFDFEEFQKEMKEYSPDYRKYYKAVNIDEKLYYVHIRQLEDSGIKLEAWVKPTTSGTKNYKEQGYKPLPKTFSFTEAFNKIVEETKVGKKI